MAKKPYDLTARDRQLLEHVSRYRLATDAIFRKCYFPDVQDHGPVRKVAGRLVARKYLREFSFGNRVSYYVLGPRGCRALDLKAREPRPFTEQSLPAALAIAYFCAARALNRLTASEFHRGYPELCRPGLRSSAYFMEDTPRGLFVGFVLIDRATPPRRMMNKIRRAIAQRYKLKKFAELMQARRFFIVVLTGFPAKKKELEEAIADKHRGPVAVRVEVVPELGALLT